MTDSLPMVLVPGLGASARLYAEQIPALWRLGPVTIAIHTLDDNIGAIARRVLHSAPPRFALIGLSMGGYISFEILRQAPERVVKLGLLDTSARADTPEQSEARRNAIAMAENGRFHELDAMLFPRLVHRGRRDDASLRSIVSAMSQEVGPAAFVRQQRAITGRPDSRPMLGSIRCPTLVLVGDSDELTPAECAAGMANGINDAQLITVPDCGHLSTLEQPQAVTQALVDFLGV